jgi:hypothetical protein
MEYWSGGVVDGGVMEWWSGGVVGANVEKRDPTILGCLPILQLLTPSFRISCEKHLCSPQDVVYVGENLP